jgi:hypothetical protein
MRRAWPLLLAIAALLSIAAPAQAAVRVAVRPCATTYGAGGKHPARATHATLAVGATTATQLSAFAGGGTPVVLGPRGYVCTALVGADGGVHVRLAPRGAATSGPTVDVEVEGSCVGCIATLACGLFPRAAKDTGFTCYTPRPTAERVARLLPNVRAFSDPPGVKGSGVPSGGALRATGAIVYVPDRATFAARVTCALPTSRAALCQSVIADFLARVGRR